MNHEQQETMRVQPTYYSYSKHLNPSTHHTDATSPLTITIQSNNNMPDANQQQLQSQSVSTPSSTTPQYSPAKSVSPCTPIPSIPPIPSTELMLFLDWDDTLYPTTHMMQILNRKDETGSPFVTRDETEQFHQLGKCTLSLLQHVIYKYGSHNVHIVSNSEEGWIRKSLRYAACISNVYKQIAALLVDNNIRMSSAQSIYAHKCRRNSSPIMWKMLCFADILNRNMTSFSSHIVSIGDQWLDHHALKHANRTLNNGYDKPMHHVIKVKGQPTLKDMIHEMQYIQTAFDMIFDVNIASAVVMDYSLEESRYLKARDTLL
eukprot:169415_1